MEDLLSQAPPAKGDIDQVDGKHEIIEKRFQDLLEPLSKRRKELETAKAGYQLDRDLADELVSYLVVCVSVCAISSYYNSFTIAIFCYTDLGKYGFYSSLTTLLGT